MAATLLIITVYYYWHIQGPFVLPPPLPPGSHSLPHSMFPAILIFSLFLGGIRLPASSEPLHVLLPLPGTGLSPNVHTTSFPVSLSWDLAQERAGRRPALTTWSPLVFPKTPHALLLACSFLQSTSYLLTEWSIAFFLVYLPAMRMQGPWERSLVLWLVLAGCLVGDGCSVRIGWEGSEEPVPALRLKTPSWP